MKPADEPVFLFSITVNYLLSVLFDPTVPRFSLMECVLPSLLISKFPSHSFFLKGPLVH
jgi:hypothetical protein